MIHNYIYIYIYIFFLLDSTDLNYSRCQTTPVTRWADVSQDDRRRPKRQQTHFDGASRDVLRNRQPAHPRVDGATGDVQCLHRHGDRTPGDVRSTTRTSSDQSGRYDDQGVLWVEGSGSVARSTVASKLVERSCRAAVSNDEMATL